jgi:hypothetical protein
LLAAHGLLGDRGRIGPTVASSTPAMAGPMNRADWSSRLLIATALSRCSRGTVVASIA